MLSSEVKRQHMLMLNEVKIFNSGNGAGGRNMHSTVKNSDHHVDDLCRKMAGGGSECYSKRSNGKDGMVAFSFRGERTDRLAQMQESKYGNPGSDYQ